MKKSEKHLCFPDFFIAPKGRPYHTPTCNVGLVIITDINLFQKPHYTPSPLE